MFIHTTFVQKNTEQNFYEGMKTIFFSQWHLLERWAEPAQINSQKCIPIHKYKLKDIRNSKTQAVFFGHAREIIRLKSLHQGFGGATAQARLFSVHLNCS